MAEKKNAWLGYSTKEEKELQSLNEAYKKFLSNSKTERLAAANIIREAEKAGFKNLDDLVKEGVKPAAGDRIYAVGMKKTVALFVIGKELLTEGLNILGAHIDSPRLDLKQVPLYEDTEFAYLDTHYYGGIKKFQWVALPLALYGVIAKKDGTVVKVAIGDGEDDPVVGITDILPHLAKDQMKKNAAEVIDGEKLDVMIGSRPVADEDKNAVKAGILRILKEKYDVEEEDFISAEIEVVPAGRARDFGLDRSMVIGYGQDDRVCAYTSFAALLKIKKPLRTACCLLTDKEEIGSVGATGAHSMFFENSVAKILKLMGEACHLALRECLMNSRMLSSDVSAAYDPMYAETMERKNSAMFGYGVCFNKYTGARGKSGSNDANAEYVALVRHIMDDAGVRFQTAELGKVDQGGGGTIAYISAQYAMNVIDSGVAVLSMHAPWEVCSKSDIYEAYKAYKAFLEA